MIGRRRRLGMEKVNPDPQPYGNNVTMRQAIARKANARKNPYTQDGKPGPYTQDPGSGGNYGQDPGGGGDHTPTVPKPKPLPGPQDPFAIPSYTPVKGQADPRDQTYYTNVAQLLNAARQGYSQSLLQQQYADTDYGRAQQNLTLQNQQNQRSLAADALNSGLSSSGYLNRSTTELAGNYLLQQGDLNTSKTRSDAAAEAARAALEQGFPLDVASEYAAAAERYAQLQAQNAQDSPGVLTQRALRRLRQQKRKHNRHHNH